MNTSLLAQYAYLLVTTFPLGVYGDKIETTFSGGEYGEYSREHLIVTESKFLQEVINKYLRSGKDIKPVLLYRFTKSIFDRTADLYNQEQENTLSINSSELVEILHLVDHLDLEGPETTSIFYRNLVLKSIEGEHWREILGKEGIFREVPNSDTYMQHMLREHVRLHGMEMRVLGYTATL